MTDTLPAAPPTREMPAAGPTEPESGAPPEGAAHVVEVKPSVATRRRTGSQILRVIERRTGLTWSGLALIGVMVVAWLLGKVVGGKPLYLLAYGLLAVLLFSFAVGRRPLPLEGTRSAARARLAEGEKVDMTIVLETSRRVSTFIVEERLPEALGDDMSVPVAVAEPGTALSVSYPLVAKRRGSYLIGPLVVRWGDPFGLTRREAVLTEPVEILVHPRSDDVDDRPLTRVFEDPPFRPPVSKPWPQGLEFYGMRRYAPGDDIRRVVWRAYARTGQLLVRQAEQGITDQVTILLDQDVRNHSAGGPSASFEMAVKVAASLGSSHLRNGFSVTLEGGLEQLLRPIRNASSRIEYLDALARVEPLRHAPLYKAIERVSAQVARNQHLVIITPRLDARGATAIDLLMGRGLSVLVAALTFGEESVEALARASAFGASVVEIPPRISLTNAFRHQVRSGAVR